MSLPILTGGRQRGDEAVARAELEQARAQRQQVEELAALDTRSAWAELVAARAAWEATAGTVQQAQRAYQIANVRFTNGVSTQLELSDSRLLLQQAEANRAQAARDLQVARARVALLPDLPVARRRWRRCRRARAASDAAGAARPPQPQGGSQIRNASAQGAQSQVGIAMTITGVRKTQTHNSNTVALRCVLHFESRTARGVCRAEAEKSADPAAPVVQIGAENVVPVTTGTVVVGPIISGELKPEKEATVRAEVGGSMIEVAVLEAQAVSRARCSAASRRARSRTRSSRPVPRCVRRENQLAVARREVERTEKLVNAGALAARDLDVVQNTVTAAEAQLADAKSRLASADRALGDTVIRAPFQGIVSKRTVNAGDVVSPGHRALHDHRSLVDAARGLGAVRRSARAPRRRHRRVHRPRLRQAVPGTNRAHRAAGRRDDAAGADLRGDSQRRRTPRRRPLCRRPRREPVRDRPRRAHQRRQHHGCRDAVGAARDRRQDRARERHARPPRSAHRARQRRVGPEGRRRAAARRSAGHHAGDAGQGEYDEDSSDSVLRFELLRCSSQIPPSNALSSPSSPC